MFSRSRQMITGMFGVKRAGRLSSFLFSATRESNESDYLRNVCGVACIFLPVHHQMKLKDSVLRSGNDISIKRSLFDARNATQACSGGMARGIDRSSFEDSLRCRARERESDNIAGLFMDRWAATVLRRRRSPIAPRPARRCVHYWIDVICSRWNCPSRGTQTKWKEEKKRIVFDGSFIARRCVIRSELTRM